MNKVVERIRAEIKAHGVIPFARFMELALYCPDCGYYEKEDDSVGRSGDFYTSVSVGSLFGELLAFQFADWLAQFPGERVQLVEAGAHDGRLAADILRWLQRWRSAVYERTEYVICEPSGKRQRWQRERLQEFSRQVRWLAGDARTPAARFNGVIFCNELLDALPVHRLGWDARRREWFEWGVVAAGDGFSWTRMASSRLLSEESQVRSRLAGLPTELLEALPDEFTTEVCPAAAAWWHNAATALHRGWLLTLDYGLSAEEFLAPQRAAGTLRAYQRHRLCENLLANAGEQDLTAHVEFSGIQAVGERAGLRTELFTTQAGFLAGIMKQFWPEAERRGWWTSGRSREFHTLTHPEHLGRAFRVLVQTR